MIEPPVPLPTFDEYEKNPVGTLEKYAKACDARSKRELGFAVFVCVVGVLFVAGMAVIAL